MALAGATALALALPLAWTALGTDPPTVEFDILPGLQYDLDTLPAAPLVDRGLALGSTGYAALDLYRTVEGPDQISGVNVTGREDYNPLQRSEPGATPHTCAALRGSRGGNVRVASLAPGASVCLITSQGLPVLLEIVRMPSTREGPLTVRAAAAPVDQQPPPLTMTCATRSTITTTPSTSARIPDHMTSLTGGGGQSVSNAASGPVGGADACHRS